MSTDELQALVDIVSKLTDGGVTALMWILVAKYGTFLIQIFLTSGTILVVASLAYRLLRNWGDATQAIKAIRDILGVGHAGLLTCEEIRMVVRRVAEIASQQQERP